MKLTFAFWALVATWTTAVCAANGPASSTNHPLATANVQSKVTNEAPQVPGERFTNSVDMELIKVPGGYWAGKFEVTQKEYQKVTSYNPSAFAGESRPVDSVSWDEAMEFCRKLTDQDQKEKLLPEGFRYTLPTESEWDALVADAQLKDAVTSQGASRDSTAPVGSLGANSLGLYDMRGNVSEFCLGDTGKPYRVLRGGSWQDRIEINLRLGFRTYCPPDEKKNTFGFRVLLKEK